MRTVDRIVVAAPLERTFDVAADVERWPGFLTHYRWVRMLERHESASVVEMAAWRSFGFLRFPTWWVSEMRVDRQRYEVRYRHIRGITKRMDVVWRLVARENDVEVTLVHEWSGPSWPLIGGLAANVVIGPVFIHAIASRTLAGVKREAEGT